jgi:hypothetical protein
LAAAVEGGLDVDLVVEIGVVVGTSCPKDRAIWHSGSKTLEPECRVSSSLSINIARLVIDCFNSHRGSEAAAEGALKANLHVRLDSTPEEKTNKDHTLVSCYVPYFQEALAGSLLSDSTELVVVQP